MKALAIILSGLSIILYSCTSTTPVVAVYDDIYYTPGDPAPVKKTQPATEQQTYYSNQSAPIQERSQESTQSNVPYDDYLTEEEYYPENRMESYDQSENSYDQQASDYSTEEYYDSQGNTYITNNYYSDYNNYSDDDEDYYYDYYYSSRLRRFHGSYFGCGYYDNYYTNLYWYNYDPFFWGTSIYSVGFSPFYSSYYYGSSWGYPYYYSSWYSPYSYYYGFGNPYYYSSYSYGYYNGYNNGYWNGYWNGYYNGTNSSYYYYNPNDYNYNSYDGTNSFRYGPRDDKPSNTTTHSTGRDFASKYEASVRKQGSEVSYLATSGSFSNGSSRKKLETAPATAASKYNSTANRTDSPRNQSDNTQMSRTDANRAERGNSQINVTESTRPQRDNTQMNRTDASRPQRDNTQMNRADRYSHEKQPYSGSTRENNTRTDQSRQQTRPAQKYTYEREPKANRPSYNESNRSGVSKPRVETRENTMRPRSNDQRSATPQRNSGTYQSELQRTNRAVQPSQPSRSYERSSSPSQPSRSIERSSSPSPSRSSGTINSGSSGRSGGSSSSGSSSGSSRSSGSSGSSNSGGRR